MAFKEWHLYHGHISQTTPPKDKYFVIVRSRDAFVYFALINTKPPPNNLLSADLKNCHIIIKQQDMHPVVLQYDSWLALATKSKTLFTLPHSIYDKYEELSQLKPGIITAIRIGIKNCPIIKSKIKNVLLNSNDC